VIETTNFDRKMAAANQALGWQNDPDARRAEEQAALDAFNEFEEPEDEEEEDTEGEGFSSARILVPPRLRPHTATFLADLRKLVTKFPWKINGLREEKDQAAFRKAYDEFYTGSSHDERRMVRAYREFFKYDDAMRLKRHLYPSIDAAEWRKRLAKARYPGRDRYGLTLTDKAALENDPWYNLYLSYRAVHQLYHELTTTRKKRDFESVRGFMNVVNPVREDLTVGNTEAGPASNAAEAGPASAPEAGPASAPEAGPASKRSKSEDPSNRAIYLPTGIPALIGSFITGESGSFAQQKAAMMPVDPFMEEYVESLEGRGNGRAVAPVGSRKAANVLV
jgi:hypothetical protein